MRLSGSRGSPDSSGGLGLGRFVTTTATRFVNVVVLVMHMLDLVLHLHLLLLLLFIQRRSETPVSHRSGPDDSQSRKSSNGSVARIGLVSRLASVGDGGLQGRHDLCAFLETAAPVVDCRDVPWDDCGGAISSESASASPDEARWLNEGQT